ISESKLPFDESHFAADEPPIKFETGPLEQPAAGYSGGNSALQTALRESGALRQTTAHEEPSLLEEFETLRQKAETTEQAAVAPAARPPLFAEPEPEPKAAPLLATTPPPQQLIPSGRDPLQRAARRAMPAAPNARVVNHGSQQWPVLISNPETRGVGKWKVIVALAIVFAVSAGSTL